MTSIDICLTHNWYAIKNNIHDCPIQVYDCPLDPKLSVIQILEAVSNAPKDFCMAMAEENRNIFFF